MSIISPTFIHPHLNNRNDVIELFAEMNSLIGQKNKFGKLETGHLMIPLDEL